MLALVEGTSLSTLLSWGPLAGNEAVRIALAILDVLAYLHEHGLARFDLKPSSIMLDETRVPLISDVGLAKIVDERWRLRGSESRPRRASGWGCSRYMAPEQARGEASDIRTDI